MLNMFEPNQKRFSKIGYLIPEFPGQTHIFLWRERQVLSTLGIETSLVSTRRAAKSLAPHAWSVEAEALTKYLAPFSLNDAFAAAWVLAKAGPRALGRCLQVIMRADDLPFAGKMRLAALILIAAKLVRIAEAESWNHVHVHSCADSANIALLASMLAPLTYSLTLHGPTLEGYGPNQAQKWKHARWGFAVSRKLLADLRKKLPGSLPAVLGVAPMGVNMDVIKREKPYEPWTGGPCRIFCCGRLNLIKGHVYLIETVSILKSRGFAVFLQIAGEDETGGNGYRRELVEIIRDKGLQGQIQLLGASSEQTVRQGLDNANVFALASLNEGVPVAVMEAMAMSVPIVVTDVGATSELVDHEINGLLVEAKNPIQMADAIERVLRDPELAMRMSNAAPKKVASDFNDRRSALMLAASLRSDQASGGVAGDFRFSSQPAPQT